MEGSSFERKFSALPEEEAAAREKAIAMGADPDKAVEELRAKMEGATEMVTGDAAEEAARSLEKAFEAAWEKMTPEQKERIRRRFEDN